MPNLVAIDVSVIDGRIRLVFSDRAVATAYAAYLRAQDLRPPHHQAIPGYVRAPQLHAATKEVSLSLPAFITWFITCRPDDEDAVTFTFMPEHAAPASRWAADMLLFEQVPSSQHHHHHHHEDEHRQNQNQQNDRDRDQSGPVSPGSVLYVRRLWNRGGLLKRLEEMRRASVAASASASVGMVMGGMSRGGSRVGSRVGSPLWGEGPTNGYGVNGVVGGGYGYGTNGVVNGFGVNGYGVNGVVNGNGNGRTPVALMGAGRGDIWW